MSDLRRSDSYYRKNCLDQLGIVPTQTEVKTRLGDNLAQAFFESCLPALKPYLGLTPTLDGPGDDLWVSPSDLLIGKVRLKPPLTSKHIKALTHQGILEIGQVVEEKYNHEHELDKQKALEESEELLRYLADKEKRAAIAQVREEERRRQEEIVEKLKLDFEETLKLELQKLEEELEIEKEEAVEAGKKEVEKLMQMKLELAVLETVQRLTEQFAQELIKQSKCLHEHFWYHIKQEKAKLKKAILDEKSRCKDHLEKLRTEMQCENIANVMYVLAKERRRCSCEKQILEQNFLTRLQELEKELEERGEKLQNTISDLEKLGMEIQAREEAMFEIIKQFQKFIYFVLRAVPTQAEYLLNVERIMIFELTKTVMETKPAFFQKDVSSGGSSVTATTAKTEGIVAKDYHECDNYIKYIPSATTLTSEEDLPAFTYDENLYVREDFRNMISQGLKISQSNHLWNFSVGDIQDLIQPQVSDKSSKSLQEAERSRKNSLVDRKSFVSVRFSKGFDLGIDERVLKSHSYDVGIDSDQRDDSSDEIKEPETLSLKSSHKMSKLELAKDSLTLLKEKQEKEEKEKEEETKKKLRDLKSRSLKQDSFILTAKKSVESKISGTKQVFARYKESKLSLAVDSLQLMKSRDIIKTVHSFQEVCTHTKGSSFVKKRHLVNIGIQVEPVPKSVKVSHIEMIPDPEENKLKSPSVMFSSRAKIIPTLVSEESDTIIPKKSNLPLKWVPPEEIYGKPSEISVMGDRASTAHLENQDEFTAKRVTSFIRIFREQPSLRRMFIEVHNK